MRFRLIYDGPLQSTQRDPQNGQRDRLVDHKHAIRRAFHEQLKNLWTEKRELRNWSVFANAWPNLPDQGEKQRVSITEALASENALNGYRFVPLVTEYSNLHCELDILFLRRDPPGSVLSAGDLDNRIKTLIDALRMPSNALELEGMTPQEGEDPFFCLMEDDNQVTGLRVDTDTLLAGGDARRVQLVVTVNVKPYYLTVGNSHIG
jgi:hypothetical protein